MIRLSFLFMFMIFPISNKLKSLISRHDAIAVILESIIMNSSRIHTACFDQFFTIKRILLLRVMQFKTIFKIVNLEVFKTVKVAFLHHYLQN